MVKTVLSLPTSRTTPVADRFRNIGRLALTGILVIGMVLCGFTVPANARKITIPLRTLSVFAVPGSPNVPTVYTWDHFNRGTSFTIGTAVVGGTWTVKNGSWSVASNRARSTVAANSNATINVPGIVNGQLEADLTFGTSAEAGLSFLDDGINSMVVLYKKSGATSQVRLYSLLDFGSLTPGPLPAPVATFTVGASNSAALKINIIGNIIELWWNNSLIITYGLSLPEVAALKDPGSNRVGLWAQDDALSRFDNFRFQSLQP